MEEAKDLKKEEDNARLLAGLCYVPVMLVNLIAILYVLLANKGGKYARFHAVQALFFLIAYAVVIQLIMIPGYAGMVGIFDKMSKMSGTGGGASFEGTEFMEAWTGMMLVTIPAMLLGLVFLVVSIYLAVKVASGTDIRIPFIGDIAGRFVSG